MNIQALTCPNCGASVSRSAQTKFEYICPYCESHIMLNRDADEQKKALAPGERHIIHEVRIPMHCSAEKDVRFAALERSTLFNILEEMSDIFERQKSGDELAEEIQKILSSKKEAVTKSSPESDYKKITTKLKDVFMADERFIMYKTGAFLSMNRLKSGMFLTDKRVGYLEGKNIYFVMFEELHSLQIEKGLSDAVWWYPNSIEKIFVTALAVTDREMAVILAYIVKRAIECTNEVNKIKLIMKTGG